MIHPPVSGSGCSGSRMRGTGAKTGANVGGTGCAKGMRSGRKTKQQQQQQQQVVQWKESNVQEGIVIVNELQLSKLIKRDPIQKFYDLDPEPFATGLFASVRRCRSRDTGQQFAAKFSSRARYGEDCSAEIYHEIALLSLCSPSSRVTRLHDVFETPTEIILVLEFAPGGDLQTIIDDNLVPFEADVAKFVRQLVEGLAYLHERKIAHLDIKPQNLVMMADFPDCDVKLCDFEISRVILEGTEIREILGTPDYVAPEILHYEPITLKADMWSLGVTTYVLLTGFSPFGGETDQETFCNISRAEVDFPEELFEDVSQEAQDFIRGLLVRDPGARPTAKDCLRHKWLSKKIPRTSTPPSLLRQDSSLLGNKTTQRAVSASEDPAGNETQQQKNLRKYLSKSREALFERVVQQHQQRHQKNSLRKSTLLTQYHRTRRLCESQMSLVSKSRERLLMMDQHQMSPYFSRSREKLYGLRSLSKSHEVLNLCKSATAAGGQTPQGVGLGILKTLTRATTADLSMIPLLRQRLMDHGSSTASITSSVATEQDMEEATDPPSSEYTKFSRMSSVPTSDISSPVTSTPMQELLCNSSESPNSATKSPATSTPKESLQTSSGKLLADTKTEPITQIPALLSPKLLKETIGSHSKYEVFPSNAPHRFEANNTPHEETIKREAVDATVPLNVQRTDSYTCSGKGRREDDLKNKKTVCQVERTEDNMKLENGNVSEYEATKELMSLPKESAWSQQDTPDTLDSANVKSEKIKEDSDNSKQCENGVDEESEPRYTVAQLISAFNRHQEVVTKTSLEVTMTTTEKENKIPPIIINAGNSKFPTGPNALRLFIPDIDITNEPPQRKQKRKYNLGLKFLSESEQNAETGEVSKEIIESSKDIHQIEDDESFQSLESSSSLTTSDYDSITNVSIPEDPVDEKQNEIAVEKITTAKCKEVDCFNENIDSTNNNNNHNDDSSTIYTLVTEPPTAEKFGDAETDESQHNVNVNKFQLSVEVTPSYLRSGSLSSDGSASSSEGSGSMSWEELTPPSTATPSSNKNEPQQWRQKRASLSPGRRQASRSRSPSVNRESWGRICTGTYNRAMEKLVSKQETTVSADPNRRPNRKSLTLLSPPQVISSSEKVRRKSIPVIKQFS